MVCVDDNSLQAKFHNQNQLTLFEGWRPLRVMRLIKYFCNSFRCYYCTVNILFIASGMYYYYYYYLLE